MKIKPNQLILHGAERFAADEEYDVSEGLGFYFVHSGWAEDVSGATATPVTANAAVTLDVQDVGSGHSASNAG